jgi:hypothetical protein
VATCVGNCYDGTGRSREDEQGGGANPQWRIPREAVDAGAGGARERGPVEVAGAEVDSVGAVAAVRTRSSLADREGDAAAREARGRTMIASARSAGTRSGTSAAGPVGKGSAQSAAGR